MLKNIYCLEMASDNLESDLEKGMVSPSTDNGTISERPTTTSTGTTAPLVERYSLRVGCMCHSSIAYGFTSDVT